MNRNSPITAVLIAAFAQAAEAQQPDHAQLLFDSAQSAWQAGDYPSALARLRRALTGPAAERLLEPVALLTGELYRVTEIAPPDRYVVNITEHPPRWSPDGSYFSFESQSGGRRLIHLYRHASGRPERAVELEGFGLRYSDDAAKVAFFRTSGATTAVIERDLATGAETVVPGATGFTAGTLGYAGGSLFLSGVRGGGEPQLFRLSGADTPGAVGAAGEARRILSVLPGGKLLLSVGQTGFGVFDAATAQIRTYAGAAATASAAGEVIAYLTREGGETAINVLTVSDGRSRVVARTTAPVANPVVSPNGQRIVYQLMPREDWELYVINVAGGEPQRLTREIQHDHTPRFLSNERLLGVIGENRHRRSYLYDLGSGARTRLFHNNQIRTVSMEYFWAPSPEGNKVLIVADRDGDTISPERGVYVVDLTSRVTTAEVLDRLQRMAAAEQDLRERGRAMFAPISARVRAVLQPADLARVYAYQKALFDFDTKYMTQPGNRKAAEYIFNTLKSFGYEPEYQWFEPRPGMRTANVIATLKGTRDPELVYVVSSHFDSVERGPGADDNSSGTAALLEAARLLAGRPEPTTIKFVWFTGEEAGLLGSREFVRQAVAAGMKLIGALNNDMIGYANDERLDNTIRYSNVGLRDLQHAAAFLFTQLITYDSRYYQNTDAHAYYEAYGDIVGGIGSYPILGNPHYHQPHDVLETINHRLVTEVAKTTVASLMLMSRAPARLKTVSARTGAGGVEVSWSAAPESNVNAYLVAYGPPGAAPARRIRVGAGTRARVPDARPGDQVWVKAVNAQGLEAWDWARTTVQ